MNQVQFVITGSFAALEPRVYPGVSIVLSSETEALYKSLYGVDVSNDLINFKVPIYNTLASEHLNYNIYRAIKTGHLQWMYCIADYLPNNELCTIGEITTMSQEAFADPNKNIVNGYIPANGQLLSVAEQTDLFSIIGPTYGGNTRTTFRIPLLNQQAHNKQGNYGTLKLPAQWPAKSQTDIYAICLEGKYPQQKATQAPQYSTSNDNDIPCNQYKNAIAGLNHFPNACCAIIKRY